MMKKTAILALLSAFVFALCSCGENAENLPIENDTAAFSVSEISADTKAENIPNSAVFSEEITESKDDTAAINTNETEIPVNEYFYIKRRECSGYIIEYPCFDESALDKNDAQKANDLFSEIADIFEKSSANADTDGYGAAESGIYGRVLSVMMQYKYPSGMDKVYVKAVNFNLDTGKLMSSKEVIEAGFYTNENVEDSICWYAASKRRNDIKLDILSECWAEGVNPEYDAVKELTDDVEYFTEFTLKNYRSDKDGFSDIDADIPYPYIYLNDLGGLFAEVKIAESENGEVRNMLAAIGHDEAQTARMNMKNIFDPLHQINILFPDGAVEAAYTYIKGGYNGCYEIEGHEIIKDDSLPLSSRLAYRIHAYTYDYDSGNIETLGRYAFGAADNLVWELDPSDEWKLVSNGESPIDYEDAADRNALGAVYLYPSEYIEWLAAPIADAEAAASEDYILVGALYDGTTVSVLSGKRNTEGGFDSESILFQTELDQGEWIRVFCPRITNDEPEMAIEFATGFDKGTFIYSDKDSYDIIGYAFSDEAAG